MSEYEEYEYYPTPADLKRLAVRQALEEEKERSRLLHTKKRELDTLKGIVATRGSPYSRDQSDDLAKAEVATLMKEAEAYRSRRRDQGKAEQARRRVVSRALADDDAEIFRLRQQKLILEEQEKRLRAFLEAQKKTIVTKPDTLTEKLAAKRERERDLARRHEQARARLKQEEAFSRNVTKLRYGMDLDPIPGFEEGGMGEMPSEFGEYVSMAASHVDEGDHEGTSGKREEDAATATATEDAAHSLYARNALQSQDGSHVPRGTPAVPPPHATGALGTKPSGSTPHAQPQMSPSAFPFTVKLPDNQEWASVPPGQQYLAPVYVLASPIRSAGAMSLMPMTMHPAYGTGAPPSASGAWAIPGGHTPLSPHVPPIASDGWAMPGGHAH